LMILNSSYRSPLTFNDEVIAQTERALERLRSALRPAFSQDGAAPAETVQTLHSQIQATRQGFRESMDDDFNTAGAMGCIFDLVRAINQARDGGATQDDLQPAQLELLELTGVLGLRLAEPEQKGSQAGPLVDLLVEVRTELRRQKLWALSDRVRDRLAELGVILEDSKDGSTWRWK